MLDPKKIEQVARQIQGALPKGVRELGEDVDKKSVDYYNHSSVSSI